MSQAAPADPLAYEAWLEESLTVEQAAEFLNVEKQWLDRARQSGDGPEFFRLTPRQIVYVRRVLIAFRDARKHKSTAEYQRTTDVASTSTTSSGED